ncbi:MAG: glycosyltransferase family 4 protein [Rhizobiaceae bacterium]|nr:glycosyltransferase family 4 protein [Rhizobiaceae bacterium]
MKFVFLNGTSYTFDPRTPFNQPLGGTESAVAYLTAALVRAGAEVTLLNNSPVEREVDGVRIANNNPIAHKFFTDCDVFVVVARSIGLNVRRFLGPDTPIVLWSHLDSDQPNVFGLAEAAERDSWTRYVMISKWQAERFVRQYSLPEERIDIIGNGVSPAFLAEPPAPAWFETGDSPTLAYTSTPYRGLDLLLQCFPTIREAVPDVRLRIHSSMKIYGVPAQGDGFGYLYKLAQSLDGVDYVGPVSQQKLAESLRDVAALAYPSTFKETSCIAVMEAMASGAEVVTTHLGALPETLSGFGRVLPSGNYEHKFGTNPALANSFIGLVVRMLREARSNPASVAEERRRRIGFARQNYNWDARAQQWLALANRLKSGTEVTPKLP